MANLRLTRLILEDRWPGVPTPHLGIPTDGWDNTVDNFSSADDTKRALNANRSVPLGQKRVVYTDNSNCPGTYTMMYLCFHSFEDANDVSGDFSDGMFWCSRIRTGCTSQSEWADTSRGPYFVVTLCPSGSDVTKGTPVAVPCSTHAESDGSVAATNGYGDGYGWFWVGGVCPCKDVTIMDDSLYLTGVDITVDTLMGPGSVMLEITGATADLQSCEVSNILDATGLVGRDTSALRIGWACESGA